MNVRPRLHIEPAVWRPAGVRCEVWRSRGGVWAVRTPRGIVLGVGAPGAVLARVREILEIPVPLAEPVQMELWS